MYFVHPQIRLRDLPKVISAFFRRANLAAVEKKLSSRFPDKQLVFTDMGRTAFRLIIEKLNLQNSEIILPAYICDIFFPILKQYNIRPIFLDIDLKTFNIKMDELKTKLTPSTRAVLVCHTYGLAMDIEKIREIIAIHHPPSIIPHPFIIEDCAHAFGVRNGDPLSASGGERVSVNSGDVSFFSLYKQFPTLRGGMLVLPRDAELKKYTYVQKFNQLELPQTYFNFRDFISFLNCFSPFAYLFKKFGGSVAHKVLREEKMAEPAGTNSVSLNLFAAFLDDFEKSQNQRKEIALLFQEELKKLGFEVQESRDNVFCYLSALVPRHLAEKRDALVQRLRKHKIFCTRIWHTPIILNSQAQKEYQIDLSQFPNTLEAAKRIINFPLQNHIKKSDIEIMTKQIKRVIL